MNESSKIKILFRHRSMEMGGVQKVLLDLLNNLNRDRFEIALLLNLHQGVLLEEIPKDIKVSYLAEGKENFSKNLFINKIQLIFRQLKLNFYNFFPNANKNKVPFEPHIEIGLFHYDLVGLLNSPYKHAKKVCWSHGPLSITEKPQMYVDQYSQCDLTVFVSKDTLDDAIKTSKGRIKNGVVIYNAFDVKDIRNKAEQEKFTLPNDQPSFVSVGRLAEQKGYDILLNTHEKLVKDGFAHRIYILGGGHLENELKEQIAARKLEDSFILLGQIENPFPYIKAADFYVQSSRFEAYPLTIGEALILKKVIVSTDVGGIREMIEHGKTGLLTQVSEESIYDGMKQILTNPQLVSEIQSNLENIDGKFDRQKIYDKVEQTILDLYYRK